MATPIDRETARVVSLLKLDTKDDYRRVYGVGQLTSAMSEPLEPGKSYHILTGGHVDLLAHYLWIFRHYDKIKRIFMSCWAISNPDITILEQLCEKGVLEEIEVLVGDIFPSRYAREWERLHALQERQYVRGIYKSKIHSKIMLIEASNGDHIVVESSANCNMNPRIEQSVITKSKELFDFYDTYFHNVFREEATMKAMKRMQELPFDEYYEVEE